MKAAESVFEEFIDAISAAEDDDSFEQVASRAAKRLGFRWYAYLCLSNGAPKLISSYPKTWTSRYFDLAYQHLDPVVQRARLEHDLFKWGGAASEPKANREQKRFFEEATTFGIKSGITVPIKSRYGRMAAFTFATDEPEARTDLLARDSKDVLRLVGLYFHTHLSTRGEGRVIGSTGSGSKEALTERERQCISWISQGKAVADIAILIGIAPRTVTFHLENARRKLDAASIAQCVAEALRRDLLS